VHNIRATVTLIVCGAPLAARAPDVVSALTAADLAVSVIGTPASAGWLDLGALTRSAGDAPKLWFRAPDAGERSQVPDAVVVCPGTFNTLNKAAVGAADTYALGRLCEAIAMRTPTVVVPLVSHRLWGHPAWARTRAVFGQVGAVLLDPRSGGELEPSSEAAPGDDLVTGFDPTWVVSAVRGVLG
jgi:phosphopantothenoylcysteine decarboxylase